MSLISIRTIHTVEELGLVRDLENLIWAGDDAVPVHQTLTAVKNGGMVIGAFLSEQLIGFQYSFPGFNGKEAYLCSHSMGIHPDFRKAGIGEKLKLRQREEAHQMGYRLITWTYDPLETVNGYLNLTKLGAYCRTYVENCYGEMTDLFNAGLPSDRFLVEWDTAGDSPCERVERHPADLVAIEVDTVSLPYPLPVQTKLHTTDQATVIWVPVPSQFQEIKALDMKTAIEWRMKTREVFTTYFDRGWKATQLSKGEGSGLHYYGLVKQRGE
ncbi:GNAT family N-acetyltransferase [Ammoniphilus sp. YIM 78166]|uniref:GNAT family N-acetyltransferase n=1 Tax=Ammoniphilus sp. YIM 78166 TaxID=1644106 RepID=UPI0010705622|nr:GNAT family N-acetyltransferase [Ammoniphilus sp. YIM 78166]